MPQPSKTFKTHGEQIALLRCRGMQINDVATLGESWKVETHPELAAAKKALNRCFGQLTLIQYLLTVLGIGDRTLLPRTLSTYPDIPALPISHMGTPKDWQTLPLWQS